MAEITEVVGKFIEDTVKLIVDNPEEVKIAVVNTTKSILVQINVSKDNIGQVIGRNGRTINALTLLSTAVKNTQFLGDKKDIFIEIIEDENSDFYAKRKKE